MGLVGGAVGATVSGFLWFIRFSRKAKGTRYGSKLFRSASVRGKKAYRKKVRSFNSSKKKTKYMMNFPGVALNTLIKYYVVYELFLISKEAFNFGFNLYDLSRDDLTEEQKQESLTVLRAFEQFDSDTFAVLSTLGVAIRNKEFKTFNARVLNGGANPDGYKSGSKMRYEYSYASTDGHKNGSFNANQSETKTRHARGKTGVWQYMLNGFKATKDKATSNLKNVGFSFTNLKSNKLKVVAFAAVSFVLAISAIAYSHSATDKELQDETDEFDSQKEEDKRKDKEFEEKMGNVSDRISAYLLLKDNGFEAFNRVIFDGKPVYLIDVVDRMMQFYHTYIVEPSKAWYKLGILDSSGIDPMERVHIVTIVNHVIDNLVLSGMGLPKFFYDRLMAGIEMLDKVLHYDDYDDTYMSEHMRRTLSETQGYTSGMNKLSPEEKIIKQSENPGQPTNNVDQNLDLTSNSTNDVSMFNVGRSNYA